MRNIRPITDPSRPKVYIETYGCQMNVNDSEVILSILQDAGYVLTENIEEADVVLQPSGETYPYSVAGEMRYDWRMKIGDSFAVASNGNMYCAKGVFRHNTKVGREVNLQDGKVQIKCKSDQNGNYTRYPLLEFFDGNALCTLVARKLGNTWDLAVITDKTADDFFTTV